MDDQQQAVDVPPDAAHAASQTGAYYPAEAYDPLRPPTLLTTIQCPQCPSYPGNFFRTVDWCPDGSTLLTTSEDHTLRLYTFPPTADYSRSHLPLVLSSTLPLAAPLTAHLWHPYASPSSPQPSAYSLLVATRSRPVQLLSAHTGEKLASYRIVDARERFLSPLSLAWDPASLGTDPTFWAGHEGALEVFRLSRPGEGERIPLAGTRKSRSGQRGLISALAFNPLDPDVLAVGSYSRTVGLYSASDPRQGLLVPVPGGVTQLTWTAGGWLVAGMRGTGEVWAWDGRMFGLGREVVLRPSSATPAQGGSVGEGWEGLGGGKSGGGEEVTQQRLLHSLHPLGRYLSIPSPAGTVQTYDLHPLHSRSYPSSSENLHTSAGLEPVSTWKAHTDSIGAVAFHPNPAVALMATVCGSRRFVEDEDDELESVLQVDGPPLAVDAGGARANGERVVGLTGSDSSSEEDESPSDEDSDESSSGSSVEVISAPSKKSEGRIRFSEVLRLSRPRPRGATLKLWRFPDLVPPP